MECGHRVQAHGNEWKSFYSLLLKDFLEMKVFPAEVESRLRYSINDLPASSCSDEELMRLLRKYDHEESGLVMVEQIQEGQLFDIGEGRLFKKGKKLRKRYQCLEVKTGRLYLFSGIYEVKAM
jgi:hypothetical protein